MLALISLTCLAASTSMMTNGDFANGLTAWNPAPADVRAEIVADPQYKNAVHIIIPQEAKAGYPQIRQDFPATQNQFVEAHVLVRTGAVTNGVGPYFAVEFYDAAKKRLSFEQALLPGNPADSKTWTPLHVRAIAPENTVSAAFVLILNGNGDGYFTQASATIRQLSPIKPINGPVTLNVTKEVVCDSLIGFGAEDDGWFYNPENAQHGVTEDDWKIREGRIDWMKSSWVRMFCWYKDWNPSGDWETFDFDTPNMQSHYRTLDQYQRLGTLINLTGVEWGVKDPYADPARVARALGALMEHLVRTKGYSCVQEWTLSNEPNGDFMRRPGHDFKRFVEIHRLVKAEFERRKLPIRIVGSDDTDGFTLFEQCVKDDTYFAVSDYFSSHRYIQYGSRNLLPFFLDERLELLAQRTPRKKLMIAEFGFQDSRSATLENPLMETYPYAIWASAFAIDGLNRGVAGFCIWCLHETYYPGNGFMNYALWDYKDNQWKPRPIYHAWSAFTRFARRGDPVRRCESSHDPQVLGTVAGDTLFWVNQSEQEAEIVIKGFAPKEVRIMTEKTLEGDRDCGTVHPLEKGRFTAPPMSFGYAR